MATATTTKRPRKVTSPKPQAEAPSASANGNGETPAPNGDGSELTAAFWQAIDKRNDTGEVPAAQLAAVKAAYATTAPQKRANLVKNLNLEAADRILNDKGEFDQTIAQARKVLADAIEEARGETSRSERPAHDPVPDVARVIHALRQYEASLLAELTDDQRAAVAKVKVNPDDEETKGTETRVVKALASLRNSAVNGRSGYSGHRASATDIAAKLRAAVHEADHPLTLAEAKDATGLPQATIYTRWTKTQTQGVKTYKDDKGRMVFDKDTDPA